MSRIRLRRITNLKLVNAQPGEVLSEMLSPGLEFCSRARGRGSWIYRFRSPVARTENGGAVQRAVLIGEYPNMGLEAAREEFAIWRGAVKAKRDPYIERTEAAEAKRAELQAKAAAERARRLTLRAAAESKGFAEYLEGKVKHPQRCLQYLRYTLDVPVTGGLLGEVSVFELTRDHALEVVRWLTANGVPKPKWKTKRTGPRNCLGNRGSEALHAFFKWAAGDDGIAGLRGTPNPAASLPRNPKRTRDRVLTQDELAAAWSAAPSLGFPGAQFARLVILTGCRGGEILTLRWNPDPEGRSGHVDRAAGVLLFPPGSTKNGQEHVVYLNDTINAVLNSFPPLTGPRLFTRSNGKFYSNIRDYLLKDLHAASGTSGWSWHDIRRTFVTQMQALGVREEVLRKLINHVTGTQDLGVLAVYARHKYEQERRDALGKWAAHVERIASESATGRALA